MKLQNNAFTLIEILLWILIVTTVIIAGFQALSALGAGKIRLIQETNLQKDAFLFSEKLFTTIKKGWGIDYEEYFNRSVLLSSSSSGHYINDSGFWNYGFAGNVWTSAYGEGFYYCRSWLGESNKISWSGGCVANNNYFTATMIDRDFSNTPQRYGQYSFQFLDYNSNYNNDGGDENWNGSIQGDDDDEYTGFGPEVFPPGDFIKELYLLSGDKKKRTYFRYSVQKDPFASVIDFCTIDSNNIMTGSGCLGTIEVLYLEWRDWWMDHIVATNDFTENDWVIDTWIVSPDITGTSVVVAGNANMDLYWVALFPRSIHVENFSLQLYPHIDAQQAWKQVLNQWNMAPYLRLSYVLSPSWKAKRFRTGTVRKIPFSSTINLSDIYSK